MARTPNAKANRVDILVSSSLMMVLGSVGLMGETTTPTASSHRTSLGISERGTRSHAHGSRKSAPSQFRVTEGLFQDSAMKGADGYSFASHSMNL